MIKGFQQSPLITSGIIVSNLPTTVNHSYLNLDYVRIDSPYISVQFDLPASLLRDVLAFPYRIDLVDYCGFMVSYTKCLFKTMPNNCDRYLGC